METCFRCDEGFVKSYRYVKDAKNSYVYKDGTSSGSYETFNEVTTCVEEMKENDVNSKGQESLRQQSANPFSSTRFKFYNDRFDQIEKQVDHIIDTYFV